jgi:hypothetical protein
MVSIFKFFIIFGENYPIGIEYAVLFVVSVVSDRIASDGLLNFKAVRLCLPMKEPFIPFQTDSPHGGTVLMKYPSHSRPLQVAATLALIVGTGNLASAESRSSYNTKISGITVSFDGGTSNVSKLFGFSMTGAQVTLGATAYTLNDIRKFVLLYDMDPNNGPIPKNTVAIGNVGSQKIWTASTSTAGPGAFYGWETTNGTLKNGQFQPSVSGFDTTKVFALTTPLSGQASANLVGFGFDISIKGTAGNASPFGTFDDKGNSTGFVYETLAPIPEPVFVQLGGLLGIGALSLWRLRRRK